MKKVIAVVAVCVAFVSAGVAACVDFVDPFVGTSFTGHTHPAACVPFGLVQAGPDTGNFGWAYCSGYRDEDRVIVGFSQTHLNGTGGMDLGDAMIMPVAGGPEAQEGFPWSRFRKESEKAGPGWYRVTLDDVAADVEVTASARVACYTIRYRRPGPAHLLVDAQYGIVHNRDWRARHVLSSDVAPIGTDAIGGTQEVEQWVRRAYSFKATFSRPWSKIRRLPPRDVREKGPRYLLTFNLESDEPLQVKVAKAQKDLSAGIDELILFIF